ncbi:MAG TPA: hypothetical protein VH186_17255 [Chloroflexia bacterium]|nr:hypothetical protein [Chloroflexia bacterium]
MPDQVYHGSNDTPDQWQRDLMARPTEQQQDSEKKTAYDFKELHSRFPELTGEQLRRIPVLPEGALLVQGSKYTDLMHPGREFTAGPGHHVSKGTYVVAKNDIDYPLWDYLTGVRNPDRLDQSGADNQA